MGSKLPLMTYFKAQRNGRKLLIGLKLFWVRRPNLNRWPTDYARTIPVSRATSLPHFPIHSRSSSSYEYRS